ncbi:SAM-dependent methyltransferase [Amycolatopsis decaplanina]|uniref:Uncharacterized protein n=1 Tax=Amycolatopsis decaplanina DSM 44594 TaxID=1284240 RepID=M2ZMT3_9PSEU|nr:SAM-dependent methyltransferase [Amycolatopsis decaplanina]EME61714.1 hypothetical protein H074_11095 [Amycolatopsis decaplanina DSM 44594]
MRFEFDEVLKNDVVTTMLEFSRPYALMHVVTPHHHSAAEGMPPAQVLQTYIDAIPSGSYVVFSHFSDPGGREQPHRPPCAGDPEPEHQPGLFRTRCEIEEMLDGLELMDPGIVAAVGRKT